MKKLLITGASGLLGQYLCEYFKMKYKIIGVQNSTSVNIEGIVLENLDLTDKNAVLNLIKSHSPDLIVHTAALTSVDECELKPDLAYRMNVETTQNLISSLSGLETKFLYISTDHLFSGLESNCTEESLPHPVNHYAETKLQGEKVTLEYANNLILRTNFYGGHSAKKPSFSSWIYNELKAGKKISLFTDSYFTPISILALTENIELLLESNLTGIYNVVGAEKLSKYEFGMRLADCFHFSKELIAPSKIEDLKLTAKRPKDMSLSINKIKKDLPGFKIETINEGFDKISKGNLF